MTRHDTALCFEMAEPVAEPDVAQRTQATINRAVELCQQSEQIIGLIRETRASVFTNLTRLRETSK